MSQHSALFAPAVTSRRALPGSCRGSHAPLTGPSNQGTRGALRARREALVSHIPSSLAFRLDFVGKKALLARAGIVSRHFGLPRGAWPGLRVPSGWECGSQFLKPKWWSCTLSAAPNHIGWIWWKQVFAVLGSKQVSVQRAAQGLQALSQAHCLAGKKGIYVPWSTLQSGWILPSIVLRGLSVSFWSTSLLCFQEFLWCLC